VAHPSTTFLDDRFWRDVSSFTLRSQSLESDAGAVSELIGRKPFWTASFESDATSVELNSNTKVFVTGGSGFVGRELIAALRARGCDVAALARSPVATEAVVRQGAQPIAGDLSDVGVLAKGMAGCTAVIHAAANTSDWGPRKVFLESTVRGTEHVLEAAKSAGVARFVHIGTEAVLAGGKPIIDVNETAPYPEKPEGLYPWSKGLAERAVIGANSTSLETISVRPRFVWGRGDTSLLPQLLEAMRGGQWMWFGGGRYRTSTCHVRNLAEGALLALERGRAGEIYFLTDGAPVDFRTFLTDMAATQGVAAPQRSAPMWVARAMAAAGEAAWPALKLKGRPPLTRTAINLFFSEATVDDTKARTELGYTSHLSIADGLADMRAV
jgi:nucleoside-diphosphate-sugar epimerase